MTETVQDVFDDLLDSYKDFYKHDEFSYPGVADQEEAEYRERFAAALAAEKGSKSTPLTDEQETCIECHDEQTGHPLTKGEFKYQHQLLDTANFCQWCGRKLGHANE